MKTNIRPVLSRLNEESLREESHNYDIKPQDRMLAITENTGVFYNTMLRGASTRRVLEIGTSVGYSTLWFADAIQDLGGHITTIEQNPSKIKRARANFEEAKTSQMITIKQGIALEILNEMKKNQDRFDFIFIDADKENVTEYFDLAFELLNPGGIIGVDNMNYPEKYKSHMKEFDKHVRGYKDIHVVTLDIGNGQEVIKKIPA